MNDDLDPKAPGTARDPAVPGGTGGGRVPGLPGDPGAAGPPGDDDHDPVLTPAGARLRRRSRPIEAVAVEAAVLRRRTRRYGTVAAASVVVVALLGGLLVQQRRSDRGTDLASRADRAPGSAAVDRLLASLPPEPVDPTRVKLVSTVSTFRGCDALLGDLRRVGAEHVGSRGFGGFGEVYPAGTVYAERLESRDEARSSAAAATTSDTVPATTLGTNVQVAGVDELDFVKADGKLIYDLDGKGNLRITDATTLKVLSTLDVTPATTKAPGGAQPPGSGDRFFPDREPRVGDLLVAAGRIAILGSETEVSDPVKGDPSATRASTSYLTVTFVDATDPAAPKVTDRVRVEGALVSARLVKGEVRLVTTANMADLGFVTPTTPNSVAKALEVNRRSVASSTAADWIPDWQRRGEAPQPLVPCERVHVPDTFAGVAMTSMVTFPIATGRFEPAATSILAPGDTLYAGTDRVAISSGVWVDPVDRDRLKFDDWRTAVHEFTFSGNGNGNGDGDGNGDGGGVGAGATGAPSYEGSGIVDGSTVGQFAFGEIGDSLAVVTTRGTPWAQDQKTGVDLTVLTPAGTGGLIRTSKVADLAAGKGPVTAVRFVEGRVLVSTGFFGRELVVVDVTKPAAPRRAGSLTIPGDVGYFHPLPDHRALVVGSRHDEVGEGNDRRDRPWVRVQLLDVSDPDVPRIVGAWERPWVGDEVGSDHHAFTYWPERDLAMWGLRNEGPQRDRGPNAAVVLGTDGTLREVAVPVANEPNPAPAPCPTGDVTDPEARRMVGPGGVVLRCGDPKTTTIEWPRYRCQRIDGGIVARFAPGEEGRAASFLCFPAPPPTVARVLVVSGTPILMTDQTLEALDPSTFRSTAIAYHPTSPSYGPYYATAVP